MLKKSPLIGLSFVLALFNLTVLQVGQSQTANAAAPTSITIEVPCDPSQGITTATPSPVYKIWRGENIVFVSSGATTCQSAYIQPSLASVFTGLASATALTLTSPSQYFTVSGSAPLATTGSVAVYTTNISDYGLQVRFEVVEDTCATANSNWFTMPDGKCAQDFPDAPNLQQFTVPAGVSQVTVVATGGTGSPDLSGDFTPAPRGGRGNSITATLSVTPTTLINIINQDKSYPTSSCVNNAIPGTKFGGGAAHVYVPFTTNDLVAGAGGSAGCSINVGTAFSGGAGGDAGFTTDSAAAPGQIGSGNLASSGGGGGTSSVGGVGGLGINGASFDGGYLIGGYSGNQSATHGGAGGSGFTGGGAGAVGGNAAGAGGGGGSSHSTGFTIVSEKLVDIGTPAANVRIIFALAQAQTVTWAPTTSASLSIAGTFVPSVTASTDGGGAITYSVTGGTSNCSIPTNTSSVILVSTPGTCIVKASAAANGNYSAAETSVTFTYSTITQTVTWAPTLSGTLSVIGTFNPSVAASTNGGGAITYSVTGGTSNCSIPSSSSTVILVSTPGTCIVAATAAPAGIYSASSPTSVTFTFGTASQTVTWAPTTSVNLPSGATYTPTTTASTNGGGAITYAVTGGTSNCTLASPSSNVITVSTAGTCTVTASAAAAGIYSAGSLAVTFTFSAAPISGVTITNVSPNRGSTRGGTLVTITGTGFNEDARVRIDGILVQVVKQTGKTKITFRTPAHARGLVSIAVTNRNISTASILGFTYVTQND